MEPPWPHGGGNSSQGEVNDAGREHFDIEDSQVDPCLAATKSNT
jgi:hypothetical protein